jgi:GntR family transcriptional regulator
MATMTLYRRIASELRDQIRTGQLPPGTQLPTEQELAQRHGVSRNTVRLALGMLTNEGMISSSAGRGTFVRDRAALTYHASRSEMTYSGEGDAYVTEVRQQGREPSQTFRLQIVPAAADVAERLQIEEGASTIVRSLTRFVDGQPWSLQDSYYPMDLGQLAPELMSPSDVPQGTTSLLAEHGHAQVGYLDELTTRMPTPEEASTLDMAVGTPLIDYVRTGYTTERPVRVTRTVFAGDRNRILYELGNLRALYKDAEQEPS